MEDGAYARWVSCGRKTHYRSRKMARDAAVSVGRRLGKAFGSYRCGECGGYHIFTQRGRRDR